MKPRALAALCVVLLASWMTVASAQESIDPHAARVANEVSHEVLSPFCPGKTLAMCPSPAAAEVRMKIQTMAESGMDEGQIKNAVIEEYGEEFRIIEPPWTDDVGLLGLLGGGLALAVFAVVIISRRRGSSSGNTNAPAPQSEPEPDDPYLAELRKQVRD